MTKLLALLTLLAIAFLVYLFVLGRMSQSGESPGLVDGQLAACSDRPNCVCSEYPQHEAHYIEPLPMADKSAAETIRELQTIITSLGGQSRFTGETYLAANFSSKMFGFVDDVEFRIDPQAGKIHVRSASRVGYSDLGANRERVESIRQQLTKE